MTFQNRASNDISEIHDSSGIPAVFKYLLFSRKALDTALPIRGCKASDGRNRTVKKRVIWITFALVAGAFGAGRWVGGYQIVRGGSDNAAARWTARHVGAAGNHVED